MVKVWRFAGSVLLAVVLAAGAAGCGDDGNPGQRADSVPRPGSTAGDTAAPEPYTGLWTPRLLQKRLKDSGLSVTVTDSVLEVPFLHTRGALYKLSRGELRVFIYADSQSANRDFAALDSVRAAPAESKSGWEVNPTLLRSLNLLAIYTGTSDMQTERVSNAITAGLMPPEAGK